MTTTYQQNPPWVDRALRDHWDAIERRVGAKAMPLDQPTVGTKKRFAEYGCGSYGCVLPTRTKGFVFKVTSDASEAAFIAAALSIGFDETPAGIVRYAFVYELEGESRRGRRVFVLGREEAFGMGEWYHASARIPPAVEKAGVRLQAFRYWSHLARLKLKDPLVEAPTETLRKLAADRAWAEDFVSYDEIASPPSPRDTLRYRTPDDILRNHSLRGIRAAAYCIRACEIVADEMIGEDIGYLVGETLKFYLDHGMLLADVHHQNVGHVAREGYKNALFITDPGHMVPLVPKWLSVRVETV